MKPNINMKDYTALEKNARQAAYKTIAQMFRDNLDNESLLEFAQGAAMEYIETITGKDAAEDRSILNLAEIAGRKALGQFLASEFRKIPSEKRSKASRENGRLGGRPKKKNIQICDSCGAALAGDDLEYRNIN